MSADKSATAACVKERGADPFAERQILQHALDKCRHIARTVAQRGQVDPGHCQAPVQIRTETALMNVRVDRGRRAGQNAEVRGDLPSLNPDFSVAHDSREPRLDTRRQLRDVAEKDRPTACAGNQAVW